MSTFTFPEITTVLVITLWLLRPFGEWKPYGDVRDNAEQEFGNIT